MPEPRAPAEARLIVCIDFKSPDAYLARDPTFALLDALAIEADWQPFLVAPLEPPKPAMATDDRGTRHRRARALYRERDLVRYAESRGLPLRGLYRRVDSTVAAFGLDFIKRGHPERTRAYIARVFAGHFAETLDIEDPVALAQEIAALGADPAQFHRALPEAPAFLQRIREPLQSSGVFDVPTYLLDGEPFLGRQHLPRLRHLLEVAERGRSSRSPNSPKRPAL